MRSARTKANPVLRRCRKCACAGIVLVLAFLVTPAGAGDGPQFHLPAGPKMKSGLSLDLDGRGIDSTGYRPIKITIKSWQPAPSGRAYINMPLKADRQVRVVLGCWCYDPRRTVQVSQVIELPEGSASVTAEILVPQMGGFNALKVDTYEGGAKLLDLSQDLIGWPSGMQWGISWTEAQPAMLFIDGKTPPRDERLDIVQAFETNATDSGSQMLPDVRPLMNLFQDPNNQRLSRTGAPKTVVPETTKITDAALLSLLETRSRIAMMPPAELPDRWIELSQYDVAVVSFADLQAMEKSHREQLTALRDWVATGTVLIVYGCGKEFEKLSEVERILQLPALATVAASVEGRGWTGADPKDNVGHVINLVSGTVTADDGKPQSARGQLPFVSRAVHTGSLVAVAADEPFPGSRSQWSWVVNGAGEQHWKRLKRHGFSLQRTNADYWLLLIPGIGQAPVIGYLLLVSLFAVVIGPVNYLLLDRVRRLYLLLITVPVGALVVTVSLFAFAAVSDGVRMRLRARSFADLDQTTGKVAVWSRQSYYAAIAPSQGLQFPEDTIVYPLFYEPAERRGRSSTLLVWDGGQQLRGGYLASRTATQFVVCRSTSTKAHLIVNEGQMANQTPKVENQLSADIKYLLLRDSAGNYFAAQGVRDKARMELRPVTVEDAEQAMKDLSNAVMPNWPEGYDPNHSDNSLLRALMPKGNRFGRFNNDIESPQMTASLLETNLGHSLEPTKHPLPPRSYVAIVATSPVMVTGVGPVREEASFHVIRARY